MSMLSLKGICNFGCNNVNLDVKKGEILVLFGKNGAGKSTLLNVIAGLEKYRGTVQSEGIVIDGLPPQKRGIGYLFQDPLLFPHMTVEENVAYALRSSRSKRIDHKKRVSELLSLLELQGLSKRYPRSLSGGEQQRVALARAMAVNHRLLLLDEPFSGLDLAGHRFMREVLIRLRKEFDTTMLLVTHALSDVKRLSDRVAVMEKGRIVRIGKPEDVLFFSSGPFSAKSTDQDRQLFNECSYIREVN